VCVCVCVGHTGVHCKTDEPPASVGLPVLDVDSCWPKEPVLDQNQIAPQDRERAPFWGLCRVPTRLPTEKYWEEIRWPPSFVFSLRCIRVRFGLQYSFGCRNDLK